MTTTTILTRAQTKRGRKSVVKVDIPKVISDVDEAIALVTKRADLDDAEGAAENVDFYEGRHFGPNGEYWTGPQPKDPGSPAALAMVRKEFTSKNAVKEAVKSHRDGVISREPECAFTVRRPLAKKGDVVGTIELKEDEKPNEQEAARIRDLNTELLTNWWNERSVLELLQEATTHLLTTRRAVFRIYVPQRFLVGGNLPRARGLADALSKIYLLVHTYDEAGVFTDRQSVQQVGVFVDEDEEQQTAEVTFLDARGNTVIRRLTKNKQAAVTPRTPSSSAVRSVFSEDAPATSPALQEAALPLGGRLMMYEMSATEAFVSAQLREGNKSLNKAKTLRGHILNEAGFPETNFLNVALPGTLEDDPTREGGKRFVPDPIVRGASVINAWAGIEYEDGDGKKKVATPAIHNRDIPSLQAFIDCERADYRDALEESGQVHKLMAGDAVAAALSRIQAKGEFGTTLLPTVGKLNAAIRWIGETVAAYAALMLNDASLYADLRLNADCRIHTGPVLPDEINVGLTLVEKKVWSRARLQGMTGVEDGEAEDAAILADEEKLNPIKPIQVERAKLGLEADRAASQSEAGIRERRK